MHGKVARGTLSRKPFARRHLPKPQGRGLGRMVRRRHSPVALLRDRVVPSMAEPSAPALGLRFRTRWTCDVNKGVRCRCWPYPPEPRPKARYLPTRLGARDVGAEANRIRLVGPAFRAWSGPAVSNPDDAIETYPRTARHPRLVSISSFPSGCSGHPARVSNRSSEMSAVDCSELALA